jgi:hypothetical protein
MPHFRVVRVVWSTTAHNAGLAEIGFLQYATRANLPMGTETYILQQAESGETWHQESSWRDIKVLQ